MPGRKADFAYGSWAMTGVVSANLGRVCPSADKVIRGLGELVTHQCLKKQEWGKTILDRTL